MLNISHNQLNKKIDLKYYTSGEKIFRRSYRKRLNQSLLIFSLLTIFILFLPWTQTIHGSGQVTTLQPNQRPQTLQSQIPGRIEEWYITEGNYVQKGDTLLRISETKSEYFDDKLVQRTREQINAKTQSAQAYTQKVAALERQVSTLINQRTLKTQQNQNKLIQAELKVQSDSMDLEAAQTNLEIAQRRFDRIVTLQKEGLKSVRDVEEKRIKLQETQAKLISQKNKLLISRNEFINSQIEIEQTEALYSDKISKAESDLYTAQSSAYDTQAQITKLENNYSNYEKRNSLKYITAPQDGYINKVLRGGLGVTFKEGEDLVRIMPSSYQLAIETFIEPIDLPLVHIGEKVRVQFDGWPAIIFSGWPNASHGTFGAKVVAVENFISLNGRYRLLLAPDETDYPWPDALRVGSGVSTFALLEDVPIWFEIWRQLNGFPPNFYQPTKDSSKGKK